MSIKTAAEKKLLFALDYDGTVSEDIELWLGIIKLIESRGHEVVIVTMRHHHELAGLDARITDVVHWIVPTGRRAKKDFCAKFGINPNIWIDDCPHFILLDAAPDDAVPKTTVIK